jgi:hypothetical protein
MQIKVKALKTGFIDHMRKYEGDVFFITEAALRKNKDGTYLKDESGNYVLPRWVEAVDNAKSKSAKKTTVESVIESDEVI